MSNNLLVVYAECASDVARKQMEDKSTRTDDSLSSPAQPPSSPPSSSSVAAPAEAAAVAVMSNCDENANKDRFLCAVCSVTDV